MGLFLQEHEYIDFSSPTIRVKAEELFDGLSSDISKARIAYEFVRDEIPHTFDIQSDIITAKASDVLKHKTGICHAKANLLAALLRSQNIPVGFCFQRLTLGDDDSMGYSVHCYNAFYLDNRWIKVDARGNKPGVNAQFSLDEPMLAYPCRPEYDEFFWPGIYAAPHMETIQMLTNAKNLQDVLDYLPDTITESPDK
jgi:transglutaminase-like putative cysteine protease